MTERHSDPSSNEPENAASPNDEKSPKTKREEKRQKEDKDYVPVIVKRSDETLRHPDDTLEHAIEEGLEQLHRRFMSLFLSSLAAGLILGFTVMSVAVVESQMALQDFVFPTRFLTALVYPVGFVLCIMCGTQLFTEHTATAVYPILDRREKLITLLRLWAVVIIGNLIGSMASAGLLVSADEVIQAKLGYIRIGRHLVEYRGGPLFFSGLLAGWLMALGAWLIMAMRSALSQMVSIYMVTFIIGIGGLHHSIAGSVEIFSAYLISDHFSLEQIFKFIGLTIFSNLVGGSIFVALLNYGHIRKTQKPPDDQ